ncbi:MAG: helix-turn-helix domain-containing protein [Polyangiaceae bacterium]
MAQRPKDHVRYAIVSAAAEELAAVGYERATLSAIAARAGTSIGNVYKYFENKGALFDAVVPRSLVDELEALLLTRMRALLPSASSGASVASLSSLGSEHPYRIASEALDQFAFTHRAQLIFLLKNAAGSPYAEFAEELSQTLTRAALEFARTAYPAFTPTAPARRALHRIYRSFLTSVASLLTEEPTNQALREGTAHFTTYHLAGLAAFFERS